MPSGEEIRVVAKMLVQSQKKAVRRLIWWVAKGTEEEWTQLAVLQMAQLQAQVEPDVDVRGLPVVEKSEINSNQKV